MGCVSSKVQPDFEDAPVAVDSPSQRMRPRKCCQLPSFLKATQGAKAKLKTAPAASEDEQGTEAVVAQEELKAAQQEMARLKVEAAVAEEKQKAIEEEVARLKTEAAISEEKRKAEVAVAEATRKAADEETARLRVEAAVAEKKLNAAMEELVRVKAQQMSFDDALYWNAYSFLRSKYFNAKRDVMVLQCLISTGLKFQHPKEAPAAADFTLEKNGMLPTGTFYDVLLHQQVCEHIAKEDGELDTFLKLRMNDFGLELITSIVEKDQASRFVILVKNALGWALNFSQFLELASTYNIKNLTELQVQLIEAQDKLYELEGGRPRLLYHEPPCKNAKFVRMRIEYWRADLAEIAFQHGDRCFFLIPKLEDESLENIFTTLGSLARTYGELQQRPIFESNDNLHIMQPNNLVPVGLAIVDIHKQETMNLEELYKSLLRICPVLNHQRITHLLTVPIGYGTGHPCFANIRVQGVVEQLEHFLAKVSDQCRELRQVSVATFSPTTATEVRNCILGVKVVGEYFIDRLADMVYAPSINSWLKSPFTPDRLEASLKVLIERLRQPDTNSQDYHKLIALELRTIVDMIMDDFLLERLQLRENYKREAGSKAVMGGGVAKWLPGMVIRSRQPNYLKDDICQLCKVVYEMNSYYINKLHHSNLLNLEEVESEADDVILKLMLILRICAGFDQAMLEVPAESDCRVRLHEVRVITPDAKNQQTLRPVPAVQLATTLRVDDIDSLSAQLEQCLDISIFRHPAGLRPWCHATNPPPLSTPGIVSVRGHRTVPTLSVTSAGRRLVSFTLDDKSFMLALMKEGRFTEPLNENAMRRLPQGAQCRIYGDALLLRPSESNGFLCLQPA